MIPRAAANSHTPDGHSCMSMQMENSLKSVLVTQNSSKFQERLKLSAHTAKWTAKSNDQSCTHVLHMYLMMEVFVRTIFFFISVFMLLPKEHPDLYGRLGSKCVFNVGVFVARSNTKLWPLIN